MNRLVLVVLLLLSSPVFLPGQDIPDVQMSRGEIVFSFQVREPGELEVISRIISIDRVDGLSVRAYATPAEYLKFMQLGYAVTILPPAGAGIMAEMKENTVLSPLTVWNFYPTYPNYESLMAQFEATFPGLCDLDTLFTLNSGRRLLVLKISDNPHIDEGEPEFFYSSSMHGDETTGYILLMHLADYLLQNYGTDPEATDLVNNMEIFICPLANPDGTYYGGNSTVTGARRNNANNVDLNRNYPDPQNGPHPDGKAWQPETVAFMDFAAQRHLTAGANYHGGAEVVNYPWDTWSTLHPHDNWYFFTSREYADTVHQHAPAGYMDYLNNGITNGYAWYEVNGGRQDYMNYFHHCMESTIEVSDVKLLPSSQLLAHWDYNWRSMILLMKQAGYGVHGTVTCLTTGLPVAAKVLISGLDNNGSEVYADSAVGDYHRLLKAGTYTLEFSAPCYLTQNIPVTVSDYTTLNLDVVMVPSAGVTTAAVSSVTSSTAMAGGEVICEGSAPVTARGVCWGTASYPTTDGPHTSDGSGMGTFTSQITGLSAATTYFVRAYATNTQGTVYGENRQFTTGCGTVTAFPWTEGFENGGTIPNCWTQQQVNNSGINWTFISGSGNGHPSSPRTGNYNACLKDYSTSSNITRLITPPLDLSVLPSPVLRFWHTQAFWSPDQDILSVYYRTSATAAWNLLATYTTNIPAWKEDSLNLPEPSNEYYIAFEGNAKYGYGICLDDVSVASSIPNGRELWNIQTGAGQSVCFDALHIITVAGYGNWFEVLYGGQVTLIAGEKVELLPGTMVHSGGYLWAGIDTNGTFCGTDHILLPVFSDVNSVDFVAGSDDRYRAFPNPARSEMVLVIPESAREKKLKIRITDIYGRSLQEFSSENNIRIPLCFDGLPDGLYLIRILDGTGARVVRVVKYGR